MPRGPAATSKGPPRRIVQSLLDTIQDGNEVRKHRGPTTPLRAPMFSTTSYVVPPTLKLSVGILASSICGERRDGELMGLGIDATDDLPFARRCSAQVPGQESSNVDVLLSTRGGSASSSQPLCGVVLRQRVPSELISFFPACA